MLTISGTWGKDEVDLDHVQTVIATGVSMLVESVCACNESRAYEVGAEGPLFTLPGGDARLAVGAGYRKNDFLMAGSLPGAARTEGRRVGKGCVSQCRYGGAP